MTISLLTIHQQGIAAEAVLIKLEKQMSALTDAVAALTANVAKLATAVTTNDAAIQAEIQALNTALTTGNPAEVQAAITNISALSSTVGAQADAVAKETADLKASMPA
jgi:hypothetical protein